MDKMLYVLPMDVSTHWKGIQGMDNNYAQQGLPNSRYGFHTLLYTYV